MTRSIFTTAFLLCLLAPIGCAVTPSEEADGVDGADGVAAEDALSTSPPKAAAPKACGGFAGIACDPGEECVDDPSDDCDPANHNYDCGGLCQPKVAAPKACGGFAGIACDPGEECIDDPTDDCDPANHNYDCGGICRPKAPVRRF